MPQPMEYKTWSRDFQYMQENRYNTAQGVMNLFVSPKEVSVSCKPFGTSVLPFNKNTKILQNIPQTFFPLREKYYLILPDRNQAYVFRVVTRYRTFKKSEVLLFSEVDSTLEGQ